LRPNGYAGTADRETQDDGVPTEESHWTFLGIIVATKKSGRVFNWCTSFLQPGSPLIHLTVPSLLCHPHAAQHHEEQAVFTACYMGYVQNPSVVRVLTIWDGSAQKDIHVGDASTLQDLRVGRLKHHTWKLFRRFSFHAHGVHVSLQKNRVLKRRPDRRNPCSVYHS